MIMKQMEKQKGHPFEIANVQEVRDGFENMTSKIKPARGVTVEEIQIGNIHAEKYSLKSKGSKDNESGILFYLHGGGYFMGSCSGYRAFVTKLCKKLKYEAVSINYPLAPEHPFPAGLDDAFTSYKWLLEEKSIPAEKIILMGDSAGGGLVLALLHRIKKQNLPKPKAAICLSAWGDLTLTSESFKTKEEEDPFFTVQQITVGAAAYVNGQDPKNPELSPLYGDFSGFPPVFLQVGTRELLLDDTLSIAEKMKKQGVSVTLDVWEGMWHAFLFFSMMPVIGNLIPEFKKAMNNVKKFVDGL